MPARLLRTVVAAACAEGAGADAASVARRLGGATLEDETVALVGGAPGHRTRVYRLGSGDEVHTVRVYPGGRLRRFTAEFHEAHGGPAGTRPAMAAIADGACRIIRGRRIEHDRAGQPEALVHLDANLDETAVRELLDAPLPRGSDPGGVTVALVDSGINYTLPVMARRLARDRRGRALGYDYWDLDDRPFDNHPSRSPFFPGRHGTRVASILVREAPSMRLIPYRYPRPDLGRMADLVADATNKGAWIVAMALGSNDAAEWEAFRRAAAARPRVLFVISAGNNGRDIDERPVYPAAMDLDNMLVVTSSDSFGRLAEGSNWGRQAVDLLVPAENQAVTDHMGARGRASGSSFAVPRIAALAARLLARHPAWRAAELKAAIIGRAGPSPGHRIPVVRHGWIADPLAGD